MTPAPINCWLSLFAGYHRVWGVSGESGLWCGRSGLRGRPGHQPRQPRLHDGLQQVQQAHEELRQGQGLPQDQVRQPLLSLSALPPGVGRCSLLYLLHSSSNHSTQPTTYHHTLLIKRVSIRVQWRHENPDFGFCSKDWLWQTLNHHTKGKGGRCNETEACLKIIL